jgi:hypothetical protein
MQYPWPFYVISTMGSLLLLSSIMPDMVAAFKAKNIQGANWKSQALVCCALVCTITANTWTGNWPFVVNDIISFCLCSTLGYVRWKKTRQA